MTQPCETPAVPLAGDVALPLVGFGTWQLRGDAAYDAVRFALAVGYRHIDTATVYGNEAAVGRAIRDSGLPREAVFITTKLPAGDAGRERATIAESLRELGTDYIDLWLVHWPPGGAARPATWREMLAIRDEGLVRAIGVSNYSVAQLDELINATGEAPAVNQLPWSPWRHDAHRLADSRDRGVVVEGYSPLKGTDLDAAVLVDIAAAHRVSPARVVLRWHLEHNIPVIPKSAAPERIEANADIFGFALDGDEIAAIDELAATR